MFGNELVRDNVPRLIKDGGTFNMTRPLAILESGSCEVGGSAHLMMN